MRIVLDSNILVRATPGKDGSAAVLRAAIRQPNVLLLSPFLLLELSRVLRYERVRLLHGLNDDQINTYLVSLQLNAVVVDIPAEVMEIVPNDPNDDPIVATAIKGRADVLCTFDRHLHHVDVKRYCAGHGVSVLTDVELLNELARE
jgi:putative PIN family toxin of toxin-antitoxin system